MGLRKTALSVRRIMPSWQRYDRCEHGSNRNDDLVGMRGDGSKDCRYKVFRIHTNGQHGNRISEQF